MDKVCVVTALWEQREQRLTTTQINEALRLDGYSSVVLYILQTNDARAPGGAYVHTVTPPRWCIERQYVVHIEVLWTMRCVVLCVLHDALPLWKRYAWFTVGNLSPSSVVFIFRANRMF